jgi:hypothetical protein
MTVTLELTEDELSRLYSALKYREDNSELVRRLANEWLKLRRNKN